MFQARITCAQSTAVEVVVQKQPGTVVIHSAGDSSFRIEDGNIIVAYWGGVEIEYYGYQLQAEELRYNKENQQGSLIGQVTVKTGDLDVHCDKVLLDALAGEVVIPGGVRGSITTSQLTFAAGQARLSFAPGEMISGAQDITLELTRNVTLDTQAGLHINSKGIVFNGATSKLTTNSGFVLEAASLVLPGASGDHASGITNLRVTGDSLSGTIDKGGMLQSAEIAQLNIVSREVYLAADSAMFSSNPSTDKGASWELLIEGAPLKGGVHQEQHDMEFTGSSANLTIGDLGVQVIKLDGGVDVKLDEATLHADRVNVERSKDGYKMVFPGNLKATFSLLDLSGGEAGETGAIEKWLGS